MNFVGADLHKKTISLCVVTVVDGALIGAPQTLLQLVVFQNTYFFIEAAEVVEQSSGNGEINRRLK